MSKRVINKNFKYLRNNYQRQDITGIVLEGSSRSGKTISVIDFIIYYCSINSNKKINVVRHTYNSHKTTLYVDFENRLRAFGLPSPFEDAKEVNSFRIFDNKVTFIGADKSSNFEGAGADLWYFNELLDIKNNIFDDATQRLGGFWIADYNPKAVIHWVYDKILKRDDIGYLHSTFKDNPFIPEPSLKKILSYEPTPDNERQGTADLYRWQVYGLGIRTVEREAGQLIRPEAIRSIFTNQYVITKDTENYISCDVARLGRDKSVIMVWTGFKVIDIVTFDKNFINELATAINVLSIKYSVPRANIIIDEDGVGGGALDLLDEAEGFLNNSIPLPELDIIKPNYQNLKTQCYFNLARRINRNEIWIDAEISDKTKDKIKTELSVIIQDNIDLDGKQKIINKEKMKEKCGHSPDYSDCLMLREFFELRPKVFESSFI